MLLITVPAQVVCLAPLHCLADHPFLQTPYQVREAAMALLLRDPSERVATQLGLLIANVARFDFPGRCVLTL